MATERLAPAEARAVAGELIRSLRDRSPSLLRFGPFDLGPALEQRLFFALRDGDADEASGIRAAAGAAAGVARALGAAGLSLLPRRRPAVAPGGIVALIRQPARLDILAPIDTALRGLGGGPMAVVRVGQATAAPRRARQADLPQLLSPRTMWRVPGYALRGVLGIAAGQAGWAAIVGPARAVSLGRIAGRELGLIGLGAAALDAVIRRWRPAVLLSFDEVGTWSRILPTVARASGVPTLNLPHAEAADPIRVAGADYDRFAVFGPRAAATLEAAGIDPGRIVQTGAPHFDALATRPRPAEPRADVDDRSAARPRRILLAAQYVQGAMTREGLAACHRAALAAAAAVLPAEVIVLPHPVQPAGLIEGIVAATAVPAGVAVRVEHDAGLHERIDDAWLLVTGWSNSVFEAALRGVPSLMVDPGGVSPVRYAEEGLGIAVSSEAAAAAVARDLLDPAFRAAALDRSAAALREHLGPSDGRASERTARLILAMSDETSPEGPATG